MEEITQIAEIVSAFGGTGLFLWLFIREMKSHELTRQAYYNDLREIASLRQPLAVRTKQRSGDV